ncbi:MAG: hypothetical protein ACR2I2_01075, partial [Bryobacteraceae bacterium]
DRLAWAAFFLFLASLTAFQAVLAVPILGAYLFSKLKKQCPHECGHGRHECPRHIIVMMTPILGIGAWQLFEFLTTGQFPFTVALGYHHSFDRLALKLRNAEMLSIHACWIVCPLLLPPAVVLAWKRRDRDTLFLLGWIVIFFCGALAFFYSGAARYLLPIAPAVALLVSRLRPAWLATGLTLQMALSVALAVVNYRHWDGYRAFAASLQDETARHRTWVNGEWGLRYYLEAEGALPLHRDQWVPTGDIVVTSELAYPVPYNRGGRALVLVARREIDPSLPLRLIGLHARSGYATADKGLLPFDIAGSPIDEVRAEILESRAPVLSDLPMNAPEAEQQILFGISKLEDNRWRWMEERGAVSLKAPAQPLPVRVAFFIPEQAPARTVTVSVDGKAVTTRMFSGPGSYVITTSPQTGTQVGIAVDQTFTVPGDSRRLGLILTEAGFRK